MITNPRKNLGKILKERRLSVPMTLEQLSEASGVSISHLGRIENGERFPSGTIVRKIAVPLGYDENELFTLAGYLTPQSTMSEEPVPYNVRKLDPEVLKALSREPAEVQRAVIGILNTVKKIASAMPNQKRRGRPRG